MIGLYLTVPLACWRKGHAREFLESEALPPPATCYGALLSLVGETDSGRHRGCRVTAGLLNAPERSVVLRTLWRVKDGASPQGTGKNAKPDFQQLLSNTHLVIWCDSADEPDPARGLEARITCALRDPATIERFGGWSLGESTHLINDAKLLADGVPPLRCTTFLLDGDGPVTLPVWVDHVGTARTVYRTGRLVPLEDAPERRLLPQIPLAPPGGSDHG